MLTSFLSVEEFHKCFQIIWKKKSSSLIFLIVLFTVHSGGVKLFYVSMSHAFVILVVVVFCVIQFGASSVNWGC